MPIEPCECRKSRVAAMTCPRTSRGVLVWTPVDPTPWTPADGGPYGSIEIVALDGRREVLTHGTEWTHYSEESARDWARVIHLDLEIRA